MKSFLTAVFILVSSVAFCQQKDTVVKEITVNIPFTVPEVNTLLALLDQSEGNHVKIEAIKKYIIEVANKQIPAKKQ